MSYPVVLERVLPPPQRRLFGARRDLAELPTADPGTVLVFRVGKRYETPRADGHLTGTEPNVVRASAVSVVDVRPRLLHADLTLHCASPADDFVTQVGFRCRVSRPETVASGGLTDVRPMLAGYLEEDRTLQQVVTDLDVEQVNDARRLVDARIWARWELDPFTLDGLDISLVGVDVLTPDDLRSQSRKLRDERWRRQVDEQTYAREDENVQRLAEHLAKGEQQVTALGIAHGDVNIAHVLEWLRESDLRRDTQLMEMAKLMAKEGHFDRIPVDGMSIVEAFMKRIVGVAPAVAARADGKGTDDRPELPSGRDDEDDKGPQHVPDEDELAG